MLTTFEKIYYTIGDKIIVQLGDRHISLADSGKWEIINIVKAKIQDERFDISGAIHTDIIVEPSERKLISCTYEFSKNSQDEEEKTYFIALNKENRRKYLVLFDDRVRKAE